MEHCIGYDAGECQNIFISDPDEIGKNFMSLWLNMICEKENGLIKKKDRQAVSLEL